jgi:hypothetical protein
VFDHIKQPDGTHCAAFYSKIHHAALDGQGGTVLANAVLDISPIPRDVAPPDPSVKRRTAGDLKIGEMIARGRCWGRCRRGGWSRTRCRCRRGSRAWGRRLRWRGRGHRCLHCRWRRGSWRGCRGGYRRRGCGWYRRGYRHWGRCWR